MESPRGVPGGGSGYSYTHQHSRESGSGSGSGSGSSGGMGGGGAGGMVDCTADFIQPSFGFHQSNDKGGRQGTVEMAEDAMMNALGATTSPGSSNMHELPQGQEYGYGGEGAAPRTSVSSSGGGGGSHELPYVTGLGSVDSGLEALIYGDTTATTTGGGGGGGGGGGSGRKGKSPKRDRTPMRDGGGSGGSGVNKNEPSSKGGSRSTPSSFGGSLAQRMAAQQQAATGGASSSSGSFPSAVNGANSSSGAGAGASTSGANVLLRSPDRSTNSSWTMPGVIDRDDDPITPYNDHGYADVSNTSMDNSRDYGGSSGGTSLDARFGEAEGLVGGMGPSGHELGGKELFKSLPQQTALPAGGGSEGRARCCRLVIAGPSHVRGHKQSVFSKAACDNIRCIGCNFQVFVSRLRRAVLSAVYTQWICF